ncbi:MAG TPA: phenylalanine--tRNA ligase subunit alpha, partial [Acidimicrobiaceae bacterium]|nr:phenylalanine--tRNA ligase subunit alpha [Acidimicrobiaceae bacterium]
MTMMDELARIADDARARLAEAPTVDALDEVVRTTLGKKGSLKGLKRELGRLEPDERKSVGQAVNDVIDELQAA